MPFKKENIRLNYSTAEDNVAEEFYIPLLKESVRHDVAVGFFTTNGLLMILQGIEGLVSSGGTMRILIGDALSDDEYDALKEKNDYTEMYQKFDEKWSEIFSGNFSDTIKYRLEIFSWLCNRGFLEIRYASRKGGMYHKKIGILKDANKEKIVFSGSMNLTRNAIVSNKYFAEGNSEEFSVYPSWKNEIFEAYGTHKINDFEKAWEGIEPNTDTAKMPSEHYERIKKHYPKLDLPIAPINIVDPPTDKPKNVKIRIPENKTPRPYQKEIINSWFKNDAKGIIQMATGTGKTITAISATVTMIQEANLEMVLVICPSKTLVNQWIKELKEFNFIPIPAFISVTKWQKKLNDRLFNPDPKKCLCVVTTSATFLSTPFQQLIQYYPRKTLIIGDEVHNYGSEEMVKKLPESIIFRMGLSATPERHMDDEGTEAIYSYFGPDAKPIITLKDALKKYKVLTKYYYFPIQVSLNDVEYDEYEEITKQISKLVGMGHSLESKSNTSLNLRLIQRARILASSQNKIPMLAKVIKSINNPSKFLVYCGDGRVESSVSEDDARQVDETTRVLGNELGLIVSQFTQETSDEERERMQSDIASNRCDGIVAIQCLDEGVDIPEIETAFILASSSNPKQFIQRRGRILRKAPNKDKATIYDFVVTPPRYSEVSDMDKRLLSKELKRCIEFAELAENHFEARESLDNIVNKYNLHHL